VDLLVISAATRAGRSSRYW